MWNFIKKLFTGTLLTPKVSLKTLQKDILTELSSQVKALDNTPKVTKPVVVIDNVSKDEFNEAVKKVKSGAILENRVAYFKPSEFISKNDKESDGVMDPAFLVKINTARGIAGNPWTVTSGKRSPAHNKAVGGVSGSSHVKGLAADISAPSGFKKFEIVKAAIEAGFTRIGIAKSFVHLDTDPAKPQNTIWLY